MLNQGDKLGFELKRLWILFPFCVVMFLYLMYLCQYDMLHYMMHKDSYEVMEAEVLHMGMQEYSTMRVDQQRYYAEIRISNEDERTYIIPRDRSDAIGRRIKVAVHGQNSNDICRIAWIHPKDGIWILTCGLGWILVLLIVGKIASFFMLKKVFERLDKEYASAVKEKRMQISFAEPEEDCFVVLKIKRDANIEVTLEMVQIYCYRGEEEGIIKSPKMLGHTILREGDRIPTDEDGEINKEVNWGKYFI